jgi:hypothetical protein
VVTGRHAGQNTGSPDYAYTGRHEAAARTMCLAFAEVHSMDGEQRGVLACYWAEHAGPEHWDEAERIFWREAPAPSADIPRPAPAEAVA